MDYYSQYDAGDSPAGNNLEDVDVHILVVPPTLWITDLRFSYTTACTESVSAGFLRLPADSLLADVRTAAEHQLDSDALPTHFVFLRKLGRCLTRVTDKQEDILHVTSFIQPGSSSIEIFLIDCSCISRGASSTGKNATPTSLQHTSMPTSNKIKGKRNEKVRKAHQQRGGAKGIRGGEGIESDSGIGNMIAERGVLPLRERGSNNGYNASERGVLLDSRTWSNDPQHPLHYNHVHSPQARVAAGVSPPQHTAMETNSSEAVSSTRVMRGTPSRSCQVHDNTSHSQYNNDPLLGVLHHQPRTARVYITNADALRNDWRGDQPFTANINDDPGVFALLTLEPYQSAVTTNTMPTLYPVYEEDMLSTRHSQERMRDAHRYGGHVVPVKGEHRIAGRGGELSVTNAGNHGEQYLVGLGRQASGATSDTASSGSTGTTLHDERDTAQHGHTHYSPSYTSSDRDSDTCSEDGMIPNGSQSRYAQHVETLNPYTTHQPHPPTSNDTHDVSHVVDNDKQDHTSSTLQDEMMSADNTRRGTDITHVHTPQTSKQVEELISQIQSIKKEHELMLGNRKQLTDEISHHRHLMNKRRDKSDQRWKSKYYHEKQRTPLLESQLAAARSHSLARVIPTPTHLQMRDIAISPAGRPSEYANLKAQCERVASEVTALHQQLAIVRQQLTAEQQARHNTLQQQQVLQHELAKRKMMITRSRLPTSQAPD